MTIKLKGSTDGSVSLQAPADTSPTGTDKTFTLPTADGTAGQVLSTNGSGALSFVNAITEVDQWYLNTSMTADGNITNLSRNNHEGAALIGTGMSVSSGVFTFPVTGKWLVNATVMFDIDDADSILVDMNVTLDNSTYNLVARTADGNIGTGATRRGSGSIWYFLDVTDTSQVKVKFTVASFDSPGSELIGSSGSIASGFMFIRLGDT